MTEMTAEQASKARRVRSLLNDYKETFDVVAAPAVLARRQALLAEVARLRSEGVPVLSAATLAKLPS